MCRKPSKRKAVNVSNCMFCDKGQEEGDLHLVSTFDADSSIRIMITELQDTDLLARIVGGDLIAIEAKYHLKCLLKGAVHDFMGDFDVLHLVFCLAYMHKSAFID